METTAVQSSTDVADRLRRHAEAIRMLGVQRLGLFGSFSRGQQNEASDVDLLVHFAPGRKSFDAFMQLFDLLEELLRRRVEVVTEASLSPYVGPHILDEVTYVLDFS